LRSNFILMPEIQPVKRFVIFLSVIFSVALSFAANAQDEQKEKYLFIRADYSLIKIAVDDILFIEGLDDYLKIHLLNDKPVVARMTLKSILEKLPAPDFTRVHRSYVVPFSKIKMVRNKIIFINDEEIPIGSSYEKSFLKLFNK